MTDSVIENKHYLVHNNDKAICYGEHNGQVSYPPTVVFETFDNQQGLIDRMTALGYEYEAE